MENALQAPACFEDWLRDRLPDSPVWIPSLLESLLAALQAKDAYTAGHCRRVGQLTYSLARQMGLSEEDSNHAGLAGLLHDLGKIAIPDAILQKPGRLTDEEEKIMRTHPERSVEILAPLFRFPRFHALEDAIRHHHERVDGEGYPSGLGTTAIPLMSRMIIVCDTFDAITSGRPYREALAPEFATTELRRNAGTQFDSDLVQAFLAMEDGIRLVETRLAAPISRRLRLVA